MSFGIIYVTCASEKEAEKISKILLDEKLISCANIIPGMKSFFPWEGKIQTEDEIILILKTKKIFFSKIEKIINKTHSYETPCIMFLPVKKINKSYKKFLEKNLDDL